MHINDQHLCYVLDILKKQVPNHEIWAFGSRVHGKNIKKFSDLDLAVQDSQMPLKLKEKSSFSDSNLPFRVDIVTWSGIDQSFKDIIVKNYNVLQQSSK